MRMIGMPKNFIGARPGRVYSWGGSASIQTASGTVVTFPQSAERAFSGLNVYGHSTQSGTPSPENPVPIVSAGDEGEINVEVLGENLADISQVVNIGGSSYVQISDTGFSFTYSEKEDNTRLNQIPCKLKAGKQYICTAELSSNYINVYLPETEQYFEFGQTFTPNEDVNYMVVYVNSGDPYDTYTVEHFIVNVGDTALSWEPYKQPQSLTVQTPNGLPGIPVVSGGNYTDESGQQWVCDEIDLKRGKYVQRVGKVELDGTEAFELVQGIESGQPFFLLRNSINSGQSTLKGYSNYFPIVSITISGKEQGIGGWGTDLYLRWTELFSAVEDLKSFLSEKYTSGNPVRVSYILATPIETDLPAEEIASYKALHTYSPTTTVSNDAEAWMKVGYKE